MILSAFDVDGPFTEFENDPWVDRLPHRVIGLPNFWWLTSWLNRASEQLHEAPVMFAAGIDPSGHIRQSVVASDDTMEGVWWKARAMREHLAAHPEVTRVVWADDEHVDHEKDSADTVAMFPQVEFLILSPPWQTGLSEHDMLLIEEFIVQ